jgi:hypothetical protein
VEPLRSTSSPRHLALAGLAACVFAVSGPAASAGPPPSAKSLEGVWKVTKLVTAGANAGADTHPQPSLAIYSRGYFSILRDNSRDPRKPSPAAQDPARLTDAEKLARYEEWAPYAASGGTYEVKGDKIITHNVVAKQVRGMTQTEEAIILKLTGDTLVVRPAPIPGGPPSDVVERTYTRIR